MTREECFAEAEKHLRVADAKPWTGPDLQGLAAIADAWTKLGAWMDPADKTPAKRMGFGDTTSDPT